MAATKKQTAETRRRRGGKKLRMRIEDR